MSSHSNPETIVTIAIDDITNYLLSCISDESDEKRVVFIIVITILAVIVVVLLIITAYFIKYLKHLKLQQNESGKVETLKMKNALNESGLNAKSEDTTPTKATNEYDIAPDDENAHYTALNRNGNEEEEEDHYYSGLREAPLYVNASEFKNSS